MTKDEAKQKFRELVGMYGLKWTARDVPKEAWDEMAEINKHLNEQDRREAIGLPRAK